MAGGLFSSIASIAVGSGLVVSLSGMAAAGYLTSQGSKAPWGDEVDPRIEQARLMEQAVSVASKFDGAEVVLGSEGKPEIIVIADSLEEFSRYREALSGHPTKVSLGLSGPEAISTVFEDYSLALNSLPPITFGARSAELDAQGKRAVKALATLISEYPFKTEIVAQKDDIIWKSLAEQRGESLLAELSLLGAPLEKIDYKYAEVKGSLEKRIQLSATLRSVK